jgi:RNA polymerase sigma-70 factor, ECF subfamily
METNAHVGSWSGSASPAAVSLAMERYAQGDEAAFTLVYDELAPRLFGFLVRQTRNQSSAEDLVQQTFLQIHRARGRFVSKADVAPWAFAIARRLLIDDVRRRQRESATARHPEASAPAVQDDILYGRQLARLAERELGQLPPAQRRAFELLKLEGLTLAEAAAAVGTTVAAVKLRAHRAYRTLRARAEGPAVAA